MWPYIAALYIVSFALMAYLYLTAPVLADEEAGERL